MATVSIFLLGDMGESSLKLDREGVESVLTGCKAQRGLAQTRARVIVREIMSFIQIRKFDECAGIFLFCPPAIPSRAMVFDLDGCQSLDTVELYP